MPQRLRKERTGRHVRWPWLPLIAITTAALAGCVQTNWQAAPAGTQLSTSDQMMDLEASDRARRFERLAQMNGIPPPDIEQTVVPASAVPGADRPIPVIRIVFDERAFFASGSATPLPQAVPIINVIAENMHHDVPDVRLMILGHTDAIGSNASNDQLSERRAVNVLQLLVNRGVNPGQLGTVAIGKAQPIAPNDTAAGRARNRRVEFLISPSETANLQVVEMRPINPAFLRVGSATAAPPAPIQRVVFLKPVYKGPADFSEAPNAPRQIALSPVRTIPLSTPPGAAEVTGSPVSRALLPAPQTPPTSKPIPD